MNTNEFLHALDKFHLDAPHSCHIVYIGDLNVDMLNVSPSSKIWKTICDIITLRFLFESPWQPLIHNHIIYGLMCFDWVPIKMHRNILDGS